MARKQEAGLRYFPLTCKFFRDDDILLLQSRHGSAGVCIYLYVLCKVYEDEGYYMKYRGDDSVRLIARALELKAGTVRSVMSYLVGSSLLTRIDLPGDGTRSGPITVITSTGIQKQYQKSTEDKGRKVPLTVDAEIWLLRPDETASHIKVTDFSNKSGINENKSGINENKSGTYPVNEMKSNETKSEGNNNESADADQSSPSAISTRENLIKSMALSKLGEAAVDAFLAYIADLEAQEGREVNMKRVKGYITQLVQLSDSPVQRALIAQQSTREHWKGLFPLKTKKASSRGGWARENMVNHPDGYYTQMGAELERLMIQEEDALAAAFNKTLDEIFLEASPEERDAIDWKRSRDYRDIRYHDGRCVSADEWRENHGAPITEVRIS